MTLYYKLADEYLQKIKNPRVRAFGKREMMIIRENRAKRVHCVLKPFLETNKPKCLDLGCGIGDISLGLVDYGYEVIGIDTDPRAVEIANVGKSCSGKGVEFFVFNAENLDQIYPPNSFDVVLMNGVLEHLTKKDNVLRKVHHVLKPSGCLYLTTPNRLFLIDPHTGHPFTSWLDNTLHTWRSLKRILEKNRFEVYDMTSFVTKNFSKIYEQKRYHSPLKYKIYEKVGRLSRISRSDIILRLFVESFIVVGLPIK
jgi:2-polyprenyl-3-methyl-5-hydroxy-6-metoxy-1,4-benzoquinol methylase